MKKKNMTYFANETLHDSLSYILSLNSLARRPFCFQSCRKDKTNCQFNIISTTPGLDIEIDKSLSV